jgi:hypothetical protein
MVPSRRRLGRVAGLLIAFAFVLALPVPAMAIPNPPGAPTAVTARITSSDYVHNTATVSWKAPASSGSGPITKYVVTIAGSSHNAGTSLSYKAGGLTLGKTYQIYVTAYNADGPGLPSSPVLNFKAIYRPSQPMNLGAMYMSAGGGKANIQISWDVPDQDGGSGISGYTATASPANKSCSVPSGNHSCNIALPLGTHQAVVVVAKNAYGSSAPSASVSFTVPNVPGAPTGLMVAIAAWHEGKATLNLSWNAPVSSGGRPVLGYDATLGNNLLACSTSGPLTCQIVGVAPGDYTPKVTAKNVIGVGPAATVTFTVPEAPLPTPTPTATATPAPTDSPSAEPTDNPDQASPSDSGDGTPAGPTDQGGGSGIDPLMAVLGMVAALAIGVGATFAVLRMRGGMSAGGAAPGSAGGVD